LTLESKKVWSIKMKRYVWALMALILFFISCADQKSGNEISCRLSFNKSYDFKIVKYTIDLDKEKVTEQFPEPLIGDHFIPGIAPGDVLVGVKEENEYTSLIKVDTNRDGDLLNDEQHEIRPDSSVVVEVERKWENNRKEKLPYTIACYRSRGRKIFYWKAGYRTEGKLSCGEDEMLIALLDMNGDGLFDDKDSREGTNLCLDVNMDGRIWGAEEWMRSGEIIEFCNGYFTVDMIAPDGSAIILRKADLTVPRVGEKAPAFTLRTTKGGIIDSEDFIGEIILLDFWTTWCGYCLAKIPILQSLVEELSDKPVHVIAVCVDEQNRVRRAHEIIDEYHMTWTNVISGKGQKDPFWKMYGSMGNNRLGVPYYVIIDRNGMIRYAGNGGEELADLKKVISEII
jgi:peroxiredoxin